MSSVKEYIESGILELYVSGNLSEQEAQQVAQMCSQHPEVLAEVEKIEKAYLSLAEGLALKQPAITKYEATKQKLFGESKVIPLNSKTKWNSYLGWAASLVFLIGTVFYFNQYKTLETEIAQQKEAAKQVLEQNESLIEETLFQKQFIATVQKDQSIKVKLNGQEVSPQSFANVFWDKNTQQVFVDVSGLPEPPRGKVYQVWSLKLNPLTPTSIGLVEMKDGQTIFKLDNVADAQAFGITLENAGGSKVPTMEQLYTLGVI